MKKTIKTFLIAALVLIIIGSGLAILGMVMGVNVFHGAFELSEDSLMKTYTFEKDDVKNIDANVQAGSLIFEEGENDHIEIKVFYNEHNKRDVKVELDHATLEIEENDNFYFGKLFHFTGLRNDAIKIVVSLPKDISFDNVQIEEDAGKIQVEKMLVNDTLEVEINAGEVVLENIQANFIDAKCNVGSIHMDVDSVNDMKLECNVGSIYGNIQENISKFMVKVDHSLGDVTINNKNYKKYSFDKESNHQIEAKCSVGDIELYLKEE